MQYSYFIGILDNLNFAATMSWVYLAIVLTVLGALISGLMEYRITDSSKRLILTSALTILFLLAFGVAGFTVFLIEYLIVKSVIADYSSN